MKSPGKTKKTRKICHPPRMFGLGDAESKRGERRERERGKREKGLKNETPKD